MIHQLQSAGRRRILVLAEMCNPSWTSVPLVGYNMAAALARHPQLDVTLVTQVRNRPALEGDPIQKDCRVEYIDTEYIAAPFHKLAKRIRGGQQVAWTVDTAMMWPSYVAFEKQVKRRFAKEFANREFDLIHRLTPVTPTIPSYLPGRVPVPMVIGPMNGGLPWPKEFQHRAKKEKEWLLKFRGLFRLLPYYRGMMQNLAGYISGAAHVADALPARFPGLRFTLPENGVNPDVFPLTSRWQAPKPGEPYRFVSVGRLVPVKAFDLIAQALAQVPRDVKCELTIIGEGPERARLEQLKTEHGLQDRLHLPGWLSQQQVSEQLSQSHAFVFPSVKEFGGGAVLEAMALGLPCIVLAYGGPNELVTEKTGIRLPVQEESALIPLLSRAMQLLATDYELSRKFSQAAVAEVKEHYTWDAKADKIVDFYLQLIERSATAEASVLRPQRKRRRVKTENKGAKVPAAARAIG